jgi:CheY-like chemotaxis protein
MMSVKTILFVENDPVSQTMYQKRLEREGFHLECAQDGQVALDILSERAPDLVLLDLMLPKVSGADVLKFMHADPCLTNVPVIIFSNAPMTEVPPDSPLARGAKRLLKSDCTFPKLLETIQETLAAAPEFVVVEAGKTPSTQSSAAGNGESKRNGASVIAMPDSDITATKERVEFLKEALAVMPKIREHSMGYIKAPGSEASQAQLSGLHKRVHLLNTSAVQADCARVALLTNAFDELLSGIVDKPSTVTPSVLQSIAQAVDCLDGLLKNKDGYSLGPPFQAKMLVVDDDTVCNHVNVSSLKRANFEAVGVKDPAGALSLLETTQYDLVVLDVNMPGMTGFEVCEKIRRLPHYKKTPIIFVTAFSNFDNRKQSVLSGGNDFVSKPVSPVELALKVTVNLIKARVQGVHTPQLETNSHPTNGSQETPQPERQVDVEVQPPEPPSRLAPSVEPGAKNAKTAGSLRKIQPEAEPRLTSPPEHTLQSKTSTPNSQPDNGKTPSAEIYERLHQGTAGLERAKAGLEQESAERARLESQWREQVSAARALIEQAESVLQEKEARCSQLEKELAGLQQVRDELQNKFATEQQATAKSQQEIKELRERLRQGTTEWERAKTTMEQQSAERTRLESEWREQLNAAKAAAGKTETVLKEKETRCNQLEKELAGQQQVRDELQNKFATEQQAIAKLQQEAKELKAGLEQQSAERTRLESEWREQLNTAKAAAGKTETVLKEKETRCNQLEKELAGQQQVRDELQNKFATEQQAVARSQQEIKELQEHQRQSSAELERTKAGLEQESAKRARLESEYQNLADAKEALNLELRGLRENQAAREVELRDKQKKLAESLRENIQLLQLRLQEAEAFNGDSGGVSNGKPNLR